MKVFTGIAAAAVVSTALLSSTAAARADVALAPFYATVSQMTPAGPLGQVVKAEEISTPVVSARAWRIAYVSSDAQDRKTLATGLVVAPSGPAPAGGRPIVAWSHGTTGAANNCGPSQIINPAQPLNEYFLIGGDSWTDYGLPSVDKFIKDGYVVVATDYQGQGGGGRHQYAVAATNGRDLINSVRAAASLKELGAGKRAFAFGWSQGGGAILAAASMPGYIAQTGTAADGISFVGFAGLAPDDVAVDDPARHQQRSGGREMLGELETTFSDNAFDFTHFVMTMWGTQAAFPGLNMTDAFTSDGANAIDEIISKKCIHSMADTITYNYGSGYKALLSTAPTNALAWVNALIKGSVNPVKPVAPVIIFWGTKDVTVPPVMGKLYREQMCKIGANIARVQLPGEQTHYTTPGASAPFYVPWAEDRFAGKPVPNGCADSD